MGFKERLTKPEAGNKYYNRADNGGWATAIQGYPVEVGLNVLRNCVGYAAARFNEIGGYGKWKYFNYPPNAEDFWTRADSEGLKKGKEPKLGAIIVWEGVGKKAGHVAVVEKINADGSIVTSESGYNASKAFWIQTRKIGNGNWGQDSTYKFYGFIYNPAVEPEPNPVVKRVLKEGMHGEDIEELQARLHALGYMRKTEIDSDFGKITKGAVLCFQFENNLEVDACVGPATRAALGI